MLSGGEISAGASQFERPLLKGSARLDFAFQYRPLTRLVFGDDYLSFSELGVRSPEAAEHGNADFYIAQSNLLGRYALSDKTEITVDVSFKALTLRVDVDDEHHRDETVDGFGDVRLTVKSFLRYNQKFQIAGVVGISLPTGRLSPVTAASYLNHDEAALIGAIVPEHSHFQLGSGTIDPIIGVETLVRLDSRWMLFGSGNFTIPFYKNKYNYRTSPTASINLGTALRDSRGKLVPSLSVEFFYSGRDKFNGPDIVGSSGVFDGEFWVPNTGRFETSLKPSVTARARESLTIGIQLRIPVYTRIREDAVGGDIQLTEPLSVLSGISYGF